MVGASGYTGAELLRLLAEHPEIVVDTVTASSNAGSAVADLYPSLAPAYGAMRYEDLAPVELAGTDVAFLALPHGHSQRLVPDLVAHVGHIVDLGADFRLPAASYAEWYGEAHAAPEHLERFAYGLPELCRDDIGTVPHVAAPGCYPTAAVLALAPLLAQGIVDPHGIIVDAASGISGRGRALSTPSLFSETNETYAAYGLITHRHTGEIEHALGRLVPPGSAAPTVLFTPHLVPMTRGVFATCHARPAVGPGGKKLTSEHLLDVYREHYADEPFVFVTETPPTTKATSGSNACHVTVRYDPRTDSILALAAIDNLVKGAAGQAIQATNAVLGLAEDTGLTAVGMMP